jgi:hypothetical protein
MVAQAAGAAAGGPTPPLSTANILRERGKYPWEIGTFLRRLSVASSALIVQPNDFEDQETKNRRPRQFIIFVSSFGFLGKGQGNLLSRVRVRNCVQCPGFEENQNRFDLCLAFSESMFLSSIIQLKYDSYRRISKLYLNKTEEHNTASLFHPKTLSIVVEGRVIRGNCNLSYLIDFLCGSNV